MTVREYRRRANTPQEAERLQRRACPTCGCERENFQPRNRTATCCRPECSEIYWHQDRPTRDGMRRLVLREQGGNCAICKQNAIMVGEGNYILDHIRPIAMGGDQWARKNLQVLCERCNKLKTAKDMGRIAAWKGYNSRGLPVPEDRTHQAPLLEA